MEVEQQHDSLSHQGTGIGFNKFTIQLFKDQTLGIGCFGRVCKAECDDLVCAAKILHPTLFDPRAQDQIAHNKERIAPTRRFERECEFLSAIKHPNIVQYLMLHHDPETGLPVLVMELMGSSLTQFLESSTHPLPLHVQVNLCHDVVLALSFLHSNNIIHRDLSGNNVLLIGNARAKVTDFGMAKLCDLNNRTSRLSRTMCPGTDAYMPPEAMEEHPKYTEKLDCFSFGVITVQILTRQYPKPGDCKKIIKIDHPEIRGGTVKVDVPENERRQSQIKEVRSDHPLLSIALDCLKDEDTQRPSSRELCKRVGSLKESSEYNKSSKSIQEGIAVPHQSRVDESEEIEELRKQLLSKDDTIAENQKENRQLRKKLEESECEKRDLIEKLRYFEARNTKSSHKAIENSSKNVDHPPHLLLARSKKSPKETLVQRQIGNQSTNADSNCIEKGLVNHIRLTWRQGKRPPCEMYSSCNAVSDGDSVYIRPGGLTCNKNKEGRLVCVYNVKDNSWSQLPECPHRNFSIAVVNGSFIAIGGYFMYDSGGPVAVGFRRIDTNVLLSLDTARNLWIQQLPLMPTKRSDTTALTTTSALIVVGGQACVANSSASPLSTVEVMNTDTLAWSTAANLPPQLTRHSISATVCENNLYLFGVKHIFTCSLADLLGSCGDPKSKKKPLSDEVWNSFADLPVTESTGVSIHGRLLAVGGMISEEGGVYRSKAVFVYQPHKNSWEPISYMNAPRMSCSVAPLNHDGQIVVVGGNVGDTSVEIATCILANCN